MHDIYGVIYVAFNHICVHVGEEELQRKVYTYLEENVRRGEKMTEGHLKSLGLRCTRKRLRHAISMADPDGIVVRKTRKLKRRVYEVAGSHDLWHIDGNHKLVKYGMIVHGGIDGYSRYIPYLACSDNNKANTVLSCFKSGCKSLMILPRRVRSDMGGENVNVCRFMFDCFGSESKCFLTGKSTGNQKIERLFRDSTEKVLEPYIILFEFFVHEGLNVDDNMHIFVLHYLFLSRVNALLEEFRNVWNNHKVRTLHNKTPLISLCFM